MANEKAIVTLLLGSHYENRWQRYCRRNWEAYAVRHGYDLLPLDRALDVSERAAKRSAAWQKCLILSDSRIAKYQRIVWIDSDILINPLAPCVAEGVPAQMIGAADALEQFSDGRGEVEERAGDYLRWKFRNAKEYYRAAQLPDTFSRVVQTGVMVLSPPQHREILEQVYNQGRETPVGDFEMEHLSYEIMLRGCHHPLDRKFNTLWFAEMIRHYPFLLPPRRIEALPVRIMKRIWRGHSKLPSLSFLRPCVNTAFTGAAFLHFAGTSEYLPEVNPQEGSWTSLLR